jgi:MoaA/NifB/PqqE/SkfB family radical SAM enzyme
MTYVQEPPNCIQVELSEGCNLGCFFCGLQSIRDNGADGVKQISGKASAFKFMEIDNARRVAERIAEAGWNSRIEFAMHGEPTMNPDFIGIVGMFRTILPNQSLMMTSNGGGLLKGGNISNKINELMEAGLNVLLLDNYEGVRIVDKVRANYNGPHPVYDYPTDHRANPHKRRRPDQHDVVVVADIVSASDGNHATLNNHTGGAAPLNDKAEGKRCAKPFREMSVRWNGNVAMCCNDWPGVYKIGNILETPAEELWQGAGFMAARRALLHGRRDLAPCKGCDATSYRTGLLPDRLGKQTLPEPDEETWKVWEDHTAGDPYTPRVKRPWE